MGCETGCNRDVNLTAKTHLEKKFQKNLKKGVEHFGSLRLEPFTSE